MMRVCVVMLSMLDICISPPVTPSPPPPCLYQFEDFANSNAFRLLDRHRNTSTSFNDDIQGTAAVVVAALLSSHGLTNRTVAEHRYLFYGAGAAGVGIADLLAHTICTETNQTGGQLASCLEAARQKIWLVDSKGLVTSDRPDSNSLQKHKLPYAHSPDTLPSGQTANPTDNEPSDALLAAIEAVRPSVLIGVSAQGGAFTEKVCRRMAEINPHQPPVIFALSNPTSKSECSAAEAYQWTDGRVVFSSGSPFDPLHVENGQVFAPGQCNNA